MDLNYTAKVALVSGAGRGIGKSIAIELAKAGLMVICVSKNIDSCGKVAEEILANGGQAEAIAADLANASEIKVLCDSLLKKYESIDVLVNNAGITADNLLMRMSDEQWESVISTNLSSSFYFCRNLCRAMMTKRFGRIINITSVSGQMGNAGQANYSAAKAGMIGLTKSIARELAGRNITANAVAPGFIQTDMTSKLPENIKEIALSTIPMKKMGEVEDISKICTFLASDEASYITGQVIGVNGGLCI